MENCELFKVDKLQLRIFVEILIIEKKSLIKLLWISAAIEMVSNFDE